MVVCFLQAAAVCKCSSCTSAGDSHRFPPPSLPKLALLAFSGLVHIRTARAISRGRFAYQNGVEFRQRLWVGPTTVYSKRKSCRGWHSEARCLFPSWVHDVPQEVVGL